MTTTPDPKTVRDFARRAILSAAEEVDYIGIGEQFGDDENWPAEEDAYDAMHEAVNAEWKKATATVSWPDEQPQDEIAAELVATKDALNSAYRERAHLVALLAAVYPAHIGRTDPNAPDWAVITLQLPTGQAAWHIASDDEDLFQHVEQEPENAIPWDGHSTEEKYRRIDKLTAMLAEAGEPDPDVMAVPRSEIERVEQDVRDGDVRADAFDLDVEELVEIFADFMGQWDRSHEVITVGLPDHLPQLRIPHLRRAVVALQRLGRERDAALEARDAKAGEQP